MQTIKKKQIKIIEMKNKITEMKNSVGGLTAEEKYHWQRQDNRN